VGDGIVEECETAVGGEGGAGDGVGGEQCAEGGEGGGFGGGEWFDDEGIGGEVEVGGGGDGEGGDFGSAIAGGEFDEGGGRDGSDGEGGGRGEGVGGVDEECAAGDGGVALIGIECG